MSSIINNNLIIVNMDLAAEPKNNAIKIHNLKIKQSATLKLRNIVAKNTKARVMRSGSFYDKIVKAKDFVKSLGYVVKSAEEIDNFVNSDNQRTR